MNRRSFIRSVAGLAALAAAPQLAQGRAAAPFDLRAFADVDGDRILIRQKVFRLAQPAVLDLEERYVAISRCAFVYVGVLPLTEPLVTVRWRAGQQVLVEECVFNTNGMQAGARGTALMMQAPGGYPAEATP